MAVLEYQLLSLPMVWLWVMEDKYKESCPKIYIISSQKYAPAFCTLLWGKSGKRVFAWIFNQSHTYTPQFIIMCVRSTITATAEDIWKQQFAWTWTMENQWRLCLILSQEASKQLASSVVTVEGLCNSLWARCSVNDTVVTIDDGAKLKGSLKACLEDATHYWVFMFLAIWEFAHVQIPRLRRTFKRWKISYTKKFGS